MTTKKYSFSKNLMLESCKRDAVFTDMFLLKTLEQECSSDDELITRLATHFNMTISSATTIVKENLMVAVYDALSALNEDAVVIDDVETLAQANQRFGPKSDHPILLVSIEKFQILIALFSLKLVTTRFAFLLSELEISRRNANDIKLILADQINEVAKKRCEQNTKNKCTASKNVAYYKLTQWLNKTDRNTYLNSRFKLSKLYIDAAINCNASINVFCPRSVALLNDFIQEKEPLCL